MPAVSPGKIEAKNGLDLDHLAHIALVPFSPFPKISRHGSAVEWALGG
jgi:hypothetical protein